MKLPDTIKKRTSEFVSQRTNPPYNDVHSSIMSCGASQFGLESTNFKKDKPALQTEGVKFERRRYLGGR